ncbi:MAG TPA: hypothetical protein VHP64_03210 [Candidatus Limnocylindria bacterium]|nr:hypothetical protein [Candidatus Limnocylindria bacterium]
MAAFVAQARDRLAALLDAAFEDERGRFGAALEHLGDAASLGDELRAAAAAAAAAELE